MTCCPQVGRPWRPDLIAKQRGRRRLSSSPNTAANHHNAQRTTTTIESCLTDDDGPRYPRFATPNHPQKQRDRPKWA